jgi:hypothetical protein
MCAVVSYRVISISATVSLSRKLLSSDSFSIISNILLSLDMRQPDPKGLRVGCVLFLPKTKPIKRMDPREWQEQTRCEREACNNDCSMNQGGWGHPVIVVGVHNESEAQTEVVTISFVQV